MKILVHAALCLSLALGCSNSATPSGTTAPPPPVDARPPGVVDGAVQQTPVSMLPGHESLGQDTTPKEPGRLISAESFIRSYLSLFGGLAPMELQARLRGADGSALFDTWDDYLSALGLPDYRVDVPRGTQTNALMIAAFERVGVALCDRAAESDLHGSSAPAVAQRKVYAFALPTTEPDLAAFTTRFDVLHRTILGYPVRLAPAERAPRFFALYQAAVTRHRADPTTARLTPSEIGWSSVCQGLIRHPEFHLY